MILVDSSVWIAHLRGLRMPVVERLETAAGQELILVGDLILLEILQGARNDAHAAQIERGLRQFEVVPLLDGALASRAAWNYRKLREFGVTVRKMADIIIGTYCIEQGHALLHDDRDFEPMEKYLGLTIA